MLRRLRTGYLDVYFAHVDDQKIRLDEPLTACARVVASGKEIASQRVVILVSRSRWFRACVTAQKKRGARREAQDCYCGICREIR